MTDSVRFTDTTDPRLNAALDSILAEQGVFPDFAYYPEKASDELLAEIRAHNLAVVARAFAAADLVDPARQQLDAARDGLEELREKDEHEMGLCDRPPAEGGSDYDYWLGHRDATREALDLLAAAALGEQP